MLKMEKSTEFKRFDGNTPSGTLPSKWNHRGVLLNGQMFFYGGLSTIKDESECWCFIYEPSPLIISCRSSAKGSPCERSQHAMAAIGTNSALIFGGIGKRGRLNDFWVMEVQKGSGGSFIPIKWKQREIIGKAPSPRNAHSMNVVGNCCYIYGGYELYDFSMYCLDLSTWTCSDVQTAGRQPPGRAEHLMATHKHFLFLIGGDAPEGSSAMDLYVFDTSNYTWTMVIVNGKAPTLAYPCGAVYHDKIYCFFGDTISKSSKINVYDIHRKEWSQRSSSIHCKYRVGAAPVVLGDRILLHGGQDKDLNCLNDCYIFKLGDSDFRSDGNQRSLSMHNNNLTGPRNPMFSHNRVVSLTTTTTSATHSMPSASKRLPIIEDEKPSSMRNDMLVKQFGNVALSSQGTNDQANNRTDRLSMLEQDYANFKAYVMNELPGLLKREKIALKSAKHLDERVQSISREISKLTKTDESNSSGSKIAEERLLVVEEEIVGLVNHMNKVDAKVDAQQNGAEGDVAAASLKHRMTALSTEVEGVRKMVADRIQSIEWDVRFIKNLLESQ